MPSTWVTMRPVCFVAPASFVVTADHDPRRDDGGPLGRRFCWSGSKVVGDYPELTWRTLMCRNTTTAGRGVSCIVGLSGQTINQARCTVSSTGLLWRQGVPGFAMQGIDKWSVVDTSAGGWKQRHSGKLFHWMSILCTPVLLATDKKGMPVAPIAE
jgi:hypothetical protein